MVDSNRNPFYEPADVIVCTWCDGGLIVMVEAISDCAGVVHILDDKDKHKFEIDCPIATKQEKSRNQTHWTIHEYLKETTEWTKIKP